MDQITRKQVFGGSLLALVLYFIHRVRKLRKWQAKMSATCPGPKCDPWLGNIREMIDAGGFSEELFVKFHKDHGDIVRFFLGPTICNYSINNPDMLNEVFRKCRDRPYETYLFLWYLGKENLMFQRGPIVKEMRGRYGDMVAQRSQLEKVHSVSFTTFRAAVEQWTTVPSIDTYQTLGPLIYDVMGMVLFDAPWLATEEGREIYRLHKKLILESTRWVLFPVGPIFHPGFIDYLLAIKKWRGLIGNLLDRRAKDMRDHPEKYTHDESAVHLILTSKNDAGEPFFSRGRAISTMAGFLNGAYDTTHATSYWIIYHLARYPAEQRKLLEEFQRVIPAGTETPSVEELRQCEYLHAFLMESMRNRATVPINQRVNDLEDVKIGEYVIPAGTNINIPNGVVFHDERWFGENPYDFHPERFLGESEQAKTARKTWFAFGAHTRMCIGQVFALAELKALIYTLVTRTTIEMVDPSDPGEVFVEAGVNQPRNHGKFVFHKRDLKKIKEEENLKWWMAQVEALEKVQPSNKPAASVA